MKCYPNCKINLGLHVVGKRPDGYHNLETIFLPVHDLCDELEIIPAKGSDTVVRQEGIVLDNAPEDNLCMKAYRLLHDEFNIPQVEIVLRKHIHVAKQQTLKLMQLQMRYKPVPAFISYIILHGLLYDAYLVYIVRRVLRSLPSWEPMFFLYAIVVNEGRHHGITLVQMVLHLTLQDSPRHNAATAKPSSPRCSASPYW